MNVAEDVELISIADAARRFHISRQAIHDAIDRGDLTPHDRELGSPRRFVDAKEIDRKLKPQPKRT